MTTTHAAPAAHPAGVLAHGLRVVVDLMVDQHLPAPLNLSVGREHDAVMVNLASVDLEAWLEVLHVDDVRHLEQTRRVHITYYGRTAESVRVEVRVVVPRITSVELVRVGAEVSA